MLDDLHPDAIRAWYMVSQGFKVALQVASECVEAGILAPGSHVISLGGSSRGVDTAIAVQIYGYTDLFKAKVIEIICMPLNKG